MKTREEKREEFRAAIKVLMESCGYANERELAQDFAETVGSEHRTTQQSFMGVLKLGLAEYAKETFDLRNEAAVKWANQVAQLPDSDLRFPYI